MSEEQFMDDELEMENYAGEEEMLDEEMEDDFEEEFEADEVAEGETEFEEISSDEVDRVIAQLEELIETVQSDNIKTHLEEASEQIYYLIYEDEEDGETLEEAA